MKSDVIYKSALKEYPEFCDKLEKKGVVYIRTIPKDDDESSPVGRGWVNTFQSTEKSTCEQNARALNVKLEWLPNGDVKTVSPRLDAIKTLKFGDKKVWFNSVIAAYTGCGDSRNNPKEAVVYSDGEHLEEEHVLGTAKLMSELSVAFKWEKGDVLWIDNNQVLHSRAFFTPPRKIMAYLGANCPYV